MDISNKTIYAPNQYSLFMAFKNVSVVTDIKGMFENAEFCEELEKMILLLEAMGAKRKRK